jgi:hypothetical protein
MGIATKVRHAWWRFKDRVESKLEVGDFAHDDPYKLVGEQIWEHVRTNVKTNGMSYYFAEIDLWLDTAIKETMMMDVEFRDDFMAMDIALSYTIKSIIHMISIGIDLPALEILNKMDLHNREMVIGLIL